MFYYDDNLNFIKIQPIKTIGNKQFFYADNTNIVVIEIDETMSSIYNSHEVYRTKDNRCLKKFRFRGEPQNFDLQQMIQSMGLENFYKVDQNLFDENGNYRAILMPFYESTKEDILLKPTDYLTDNFSAIFRTFRRLADKLIRTSDANVENTIFQTNKIIIIDSEKYTVYPEEDKNFVIETNLGEAYWILYRTLEKAALNHPELCNDKFKEWFKKEQQSEICRKLTKYKYPIDYLRSYRQ